MGLSEEDKSERNLRYITGKDRFAYRAAAIIIEDGHVLLATNDKADYYYSIGGAVHFGETAADAAQREALEETGAEYRAERLVFVYENFFRDESGSDLRNYNCHNLELYFLMKPRGDMAATSHKSRCVDGEERLVWIPVEKLGEYKIFPPFFAEKIKNMPLSTEHIIDYKF